MQMIIEMRNRRLLLAKHELDNNDEDRTTDQNMSDGRVTITAKMLEGRHRVHGSSLCGRTSDGTWSSKGRKYATQVGDALVARAARMVSSGSQVLLLGGSRASLSLNHYRSRSGNGSKLHLA